MTSDVGVPFITTPRLAAMRSSTSSSLVMKKGGPGSSALAGGFADALVADVFVADTFAADAFEGALSFRRFLLAWVIFRLLRVVCV